jgi:large subunit ribosomal protein L6
MSRIGRRIISIPSGVTVESQGATVKVKGPKGSLSGELPRGITIAIDKGTVKFARPDDSVKTRALHGLARALINNMVTGVVEPFVKELEIQGVGYRADVSGKTLNLLLGFSHPVAVPIPEGIKVSVDRNVVVKIEGIDRRQVGQFAANIRELRPPEPYKGKGIRYLGEHVRRKVGKAAAGSSAG